MGPLPGLTAEEVKKYIRFIGNRRLEQLGLSPIYDVKKNPLVWLDTMLNGVEHMNFFEGRATEYSKASTQGTWGEVFA
jgi:ribonucleoside-diphosphate reductase beta chain